MTQDVGRATDPGRRAQPRHRLRRQDRRSSRRPAASRLLDLHRRRPRTDRAAAAQPEEVSLGRAVGEFLLRPSASGRADDHRRRTAGSARSSASPAICRSAFSRATRPSSTTACTRTNSSTSISDGCSPSRSPILPRSPTSRSCRSTTSAGASSASPIRSRSGSSTIFSNHGAEIARAGETHRRDRVSPH